MQLANKDSGRPFDAEDEQIFRVFVDHCALIVHFYHMQQRKLYHVRILLPFKANKQNVATYIGIHIFIAILVVAGDRVTCMCRRRKT